MVGQQSIDERINSSESLVCISCKDFEKYKSEITSHPRYLTHYTYKFDSPRVGVCLRKNKENK